MGSQRALHGDITYKVGAGYDGPARRTASQRQHTWVTSISHWTLSSAGGGVVAMSPR